MTIRTLSLLVIGLCISALFVRTFILLGPVVPVEVAAGSMAPTLLGPHRFATCDGCGHEFAVGFNASMPAYSATCPNCQNCDVPLASLSVRPGARLWIDRTTFLVVEPRRWDIVVFRCPTEATRLCVKRLVGLPGEVVELRDGDIYINGAIAQKSLVEQRQLRQLIHRENPSAERWRPEASESGWHRHDGQWRVVPSVAKNPFRPGVGIKTDWLVYHHPARPDGDSAIYDTTSYNVGSSRRLNRVGDIMLSIQARLSGTGELKIDFPTGRELLEIDIRPALFQVVLEQNEEGLAETTVEGARQPWTGRPVTIEVSTFDRQLLVAIDGRNLLAYPIDAECGHMRVGSNRLQVEILDLAVWRDAYYIWPAIWNRSGARPLWRLGSDEYFVLGDNSPISDDSRSWPAGHGLQRKLLLGKPLRTRL